MSRSLPEWIGKTDDTPIPPRVRLRVYERYNGICQICQCKIQAGDSWHCDHAKALILGGENRETNIVLAHAKCNGEKANVEKKAKSKIAKTKAKHLGITKNGPKIQSRGFSKSEKSARRKDKPSLPPRVLYTDE